MKYPLSKYIPNVKSSNKDKQITKLETENNIQNH
jgi:hypothetical protein